MKMKTMKKIKGKKMPQYTEKINNNWKKKIRHMNILSYGFKVNKKENGADVRF